VATPKPIALIVVLVEMFARPEKFASMEVVLFLVKIAYQNAQVNLSTCNPIVLIAEHVTQLVNLAKFVHKVNASSPVK